MVAEATEEEPRAAARDEVKDQRTTSNGQDSAQHESEDDDEGEEDTEDEAEEEPKLKYTRLTSSLGPVYRNGDATSTFLVQHHIRLNLSDLFYLKMPPFVTWKDNESIFIYRCM